MRARLRTPAGALVALQLVFVLGVGIATVAAFPVFALVDERAHYDYVAKVAEEQRLPVVGRDLIEPETAAIDDGVYPAPPRGGDLRERGLAGYSYEAFQPPLYYFVATPVYVVAGDHEVKVRLLRVLGLVLLFAAIAVTWLLTRAAVAPERALPAFSLVLTFFMWPGVIVRTVTISNASLELVLGIACVLALWRAHAGRSPGWLVAAGALTGAGLLTRLNLVYLVPLLVLVAIEPLRTPAREGAPGARRPVVPALVALVLPLVALAPWLAFNLHHFDALTASAVVRDMQEPVLNPTGRDYDLGALPDLFRGLLNGFLPEEWWVEYLATWKRALRDVAGVVLLLVPLVLGAALLRGSERRRGLVFLAGPLLLGLAVMTIGTLAGNWNFFYPRYLYPALIPFGVFAALAWRRALGSDGRLVALSATLSVALAALWAHLGTVTPFAP